MTINAHRAREQSVPSPAVPLYVSADVLHLILMPTEKCNFRCVYCYESFEQGRMSRGTVDGLRRLLERRAPSLRALTVEWFGGEPLLEVPIIVEIQEHLAALAREHADLKVCSSMTTNGYLLTPATAERLVGLGVRTYQISLDGAPSSHDARRPRADGGGTFERVWANLRAVHASDLDIRIRLRMHVDRKNQGEISSFLEVLAAELAGDPRFELYLRAVGRLGGPRDGEYPFLVNEELTAVDALRSRAIELGLRLRPASKLDACYASAANSFVVRSTGELAKCTVAFDHPNNRVGRLGTDGKAEIDNVKLNGWVRGLFDGDGAALHCPMQGFADSRPQAAASGLPVLAH